MYCHGVFVKYNYIISLLQRNNYVGILNIIRGVNKPEIRQH